MSSFLDRDFIGFFLSYFLLFACALYTKGGCRPGAGRRFERTSVKYGSRAKRYVHMEIGHAAQNIYLQAVDLDLGTVVVGAFDDEKVQRTLSMRTNELPLCIMPVGKIL
jgi:nitroreductase